MPTHDWGGGGCVPPAGLRSGKLSGAGDYNPSSRFDGGDETKFFKLDTFDKRVHTLRIRIPCEV